MCMLVGRGGFVCAGGCFEGSRAGSQGAPGVLEGFSCCLTIPCPNGINKPTRKPKNAVLGYMVHFYYYNQNIKFSDAFCHFHGPVCLSGCFISMPDPIGTGPLAPGGAGQRECRRGVLLPGTCNGPSLDWPSRVHFAWPRDWHQHRRHLSPAEFSAAHWRWNKAATPLDLGRMTSSLESINTSLTVEGEVIWQLQSNVIVSLAIVTLRMTCCLQMEPSVT